MKKPKPTVNKLLFELMKDAKKSDRELAKVLGVSQPTVSRTRKFLEKEMIEGYTAIPRWEKLGYEIFAITFFKTKSDVATKERYSAVRKKGLDWLMNQPNVIMAGASRGMGMDAFNFSMHKSYADYDEWFRNIRLELGDLIDDVQSALINLRGKELLKPLNFKYIAEKE